MNEYSYCFAAKCPTNGEVIRYRLEILSPTTIMVEDIKEACSFDNAMFHEAIADYLKWELGGRQILVAYHHGVTILTQR